MNITMILLRIVHIVGGVFWAGAIFVTTLFLLPAVGATGPAGAQFMRHLMLVRKFSVFVAGSAIVTILAGLALYWRMMSLTGGAFARSHTGMIYGIGGASAMLALIPGIAITARLSGQLTKLGQSIEAAGRAPTADEAATMERLRSRLTGGAHAAAALVGIALLAMAIARYV
jgi:uncharacterized membrane protein